MYRSFLHSMYIYFKFLAMTDKQGMLFKVNLKAHLATQEVKDTGCGQEYCEDNCRLWCIKEKK